MCRVNLFKLFNSLNIYIKISMHSGTFSFSVQWCVGEHGVTRNVRTDVRQITSQLLKDPKTVAAFQEKLATLVGNSSGYIERLEQFAIP